MKRNTEKRKNNKVPYFAVLIAALLISCRRDLAVKTYTLYTDKIKEDINIVLITDLHSTMYGEGQKNLISAIDSLSPDVILLGGDIADDNVPHKGTWQLLSYIGKKYPCFYVSGNHEFWSGEVDRIKNIIMNYGVTVLEEDTVTLDIKGEKINISGIDDPEKYGSFTASDKWAEALYKCSESIDNKNYSILLSHRPETADYYKNTAFDLILSGHAHGGQVRIPFILNGLYSPSEGFFPKYAGGYYDLGKNEMIVSRGLSKSLLPRVFNRPELVYVQLKNSNQEENA